LGVQVKNSSSLRPDRPRIESEEKSGCGACTRVSGFVREILRRRKLDRTSRPQNTTLFDYVILKLDVDGAEYDILFMGAKVRRILPSVEIKIRRVTGIGGQSAQDARASGRIQKRKNCLDLSGDPIDYSVHRSPCALHNVMPNILGCLHSALCHVGCPVDGASLNASHGDSDGEND